jgi:alkylhydroperoxidase family enzyme
MVVPTRLLPAADPESLDDDGRALLAASPLGVFAILAHARDSFVPMLRFLVAQQRSPELPLRLKELIILRVAALEGAEYEWVQHVPRALAGGVTEAEVEALRTGAPLAAPEAPAIALVEELVAGANPAAATVIAAEAALGPRGVVELTLTTSIYMMIARIVGVAGLAPEAPAPPLGRDAP